MDTTTLTDRYVSAAMRTVPERQRADLAAELRASIGDQIDARIEDGDAPGSAERAVLVELGDPDVLAAGYTERPLWLIGPRYFLDWWRLLRLLFWIVLPCAAFGVALGKALSGAAIGEVIGTTVVVLIQVTVNLGFWTTAVFALLERTLPREGKSITSSAWTPDQLPEPKAKGIGFGEMVGSLVVIVLLAGAILWDRFVGFVPGEPGLSIQDPGLWPWWIAGLFIVLALAAVHAIVLYTVGHWTWGLAAWNAVLNLAVAASAIALLSQQRLLNPDFFTTVIPRDSATTVDSVLSIVTGFLFAGTALWSIVDGFVKAGRAGSRAS